MCEFLKTFEFSDLVAIGSVVLLYMTFLQQGKTFKIQKELAEAEHENFHLQRELALLERNAKRAEYFPNFIGKASIAYSEDAYHNYERSVFVVNGELFTTENSFYIKSIKSIVHGPARFIDDVELPTYDDIIFGKNVKFKFSFCIDEDKLKQFIQEEIELDMYYQGGVDSEIRRSRGIRLEIDIRDLLDNEYTLKIFTSINAKLKIESFTKKPAN